MAKKKTDPFVHIPEQNANIFKPVSVVIMFFDVVGFTNKTTNDEMKACIRHIEGTIYDVLWQEYNWNEKNEPNDLILIPTGDGYAFAFNPHIASEEVLEIIKKFFCRLVKDIHFKIRVGIAQGQCQIHRDSNDKNNVFGYGINLANRVMGLACENQILIHDALAVDILTQREHNELHEIKKEYCLKHGGKTKVYNFYGTYQGVSFGNANDPIDPVTVKQGGK